MCKEALFIGAQHLGLDEHCLCSPKGTQVMTGLFLSHKIEGNLSFVQGRENSSPSVFFPDKRCFPSPTNSKLNDLL